MAGFFTSRDEAPATVTVARVDAPERKPRLDIPLFFAIVFLSCAWWEWISHCAEVKVLADPASGWVRAGRKRAPHQDENKEKNSPGGCLAEAIVLLY